VRPGGPRLQPAGQVGVERRHRQERRRGLAARQLRQHVGVAGDESILGDDADRVAELGAHFQAAARQP
jgi:hypothetical protein